MTTKYLNEYLRRIHCAQDYIEQHLSETLPLEAIAKAACFSPYHFHRVFTAVAGETLYQFILRLRLEKAATQLLQSPDKSVTAIALDCGFSSSATFARAFKSDFGVSASEWRSGNGCGAIGSPLPSGTDDRKDRKTQSKDGKADGGVDRYAALIGAKRQPMRSVPMPVSAQKVLVEELPAMTVAYVRHVGPYAGDNDLFDRLFGRLKAWAGPRGLLGPKSKALTIYHDNPDITEADKLRISCSVVVPKDTKPDGEIGILEIAGGKYACARFEIAPQEFGGAWQWFMASWMPSSGYQPDDGMSYELYLNDPKEHPEHKHVFEAVMPVRPL